MTFTPPLRFLFFDSAAFFLDVVYRVPEPPLLAAGAGIPCRIPARNPC